MKRRSHLQAGPAEDRGAALLLVLVVVTVIALAGAAMLSFSDTSIRTTVALRGQGAAAYAAEGAAQVAITNLSAGHGFTPGSLFDNANNTTCFGPNATSGTLNLPGFYPGSGGAAPTSASVSCLADPATGVNGTVVPITGANRPGQAILTLGRTGEVGINVEAPSTNTFSVEGSVKSNSTINVAPGATLQSTAAVTAFGACGGTIVSNPAKNCLTNTNLVDPSYASEATLVPAYQPVPTSCTSGVVTFFPGYYDDAKALTSLMTGNGPCGGSTWWFKPGTYYFDFHNNTDDPDVYRGAVTGTGRLANQWAITRGNLVAGTPVDGNGTVIASPGGSPAIPGSCQNPIRSTTAAGVQFIFGGDSQLALGGSADAEICGTYSATRPPIALYGLKSGTATTTTLSGPGSGAGAALKMSTYSEPTGRFTSLANIVQEDGAYAIWNKGSNNKQSSTINVSGYSPPSPIPPGSIVGDATVRIKHKNSKGYASADGLTIAFTPQGVAGSPPASAITLTPSTPNNTSLVTDNLDIYSGGTSAFDKYVHDNGFTGATMDYTTTLSRKAVESLDAIQIDITYVTPAFRAENIATISPSCMNQTYTRSSGTACAVLSTSTSALPSFTGAFYIQGTAYAPFAAIDLTLNSATQQVLRFGVVSRSLWVKTNPSFSYSGPVIEIPDDSPGGNGGPIVFLTVYVCPATTTSSCSTDLGAVTALRAKAMINDATPPSKMTILSWSNLR